jgi:hypothetical protein
MSEERRYDERETAEILERAAAADRPGSRVPARSATGLTLPQLQEIGSEVGIDPERIAAAARAVESRAGAGPPKTFLGAPRSVTRSVSIPRALTDDEWNRLVVALRETFGAMGNVTQHGPLRSWNVGNLQVHVEPDGERWRVRMRTLKGSVGPTILTSLALVVMAGFSLVGAVTGAGGPDLSDLVLGAALGTAGLAQLGYVRAMLPRWARERVAQMEALAERIPRLLRGGEE